MGTIVKLLLAVLSVELWSSAAADLPPPERSYNILMLLPCGTLSHLFLYLPMAQELAKRGHKVYKLKNIRCTVILTIRYESDFELIVKVNLTIVYL